ncbi:hypothetical protein YC2023_039883 [Brassica napus]
MCICCSCTATEIERTQKKMNTKYRSADFILVLLCHGGTTTSYVRRLEATADIPLDSDVFHVPPGCNAPQQYYYMVGVGQTERKLWFLTPPKPGPDIPYTFGLIGNCVLKTYYNSSSSPWEANNSLSL